MQIYTWDQNGFEQAYSKHYYKLKGCGTVHRKSCACTDSIITYSRTFFIEDPIFQMRAEKIESILNFDNGADILVLGCGLGFLMEELKKLGNNVWGVDNSSYIQTHKNRPENRNKIPIYNISVLQNNFLSEVKRVTGATWFSAIVTEDLLTSHDEFTTILSRCENLLSPDAPKTNIIHIVDTNAKSPFTEKTLEGWKSIAPTHTWLNSYGDPV